MAKNDLQAVAHGAAAKGKRLKGGQPGNVSKRQADEITTSSLSLTKRTWLLLKRVAEARSDLEGGRPSVSKVILGLIDNHTEELRKEAEAYEERRRQNDLP